MNDSQLEDELSIDSKTDKKIQIKTERAQHDDTHQEAASNSFSKSSTSAAAKPHFRIDWRQLTYYKKERRSLASHLLCNKQTKPSQPQEQPEQQQHQSIYFSDDELEPDEEVSSADGSAAQSYYGDGGRLSRASSGKQAGHSKRKPILNSLDGCFKSGELSAILGPSGAGKSTFLSALFGNKQESSYGQTKVTWFPPPVDCQTGAPPATLNTKRSVRIAILPQHDHLLNHLTVYETLMFASKIKNPHKAACKSFHRSNVKRVAKTLKLTECLQTRCGRLSGGQYKRVSIGQELLSEPDVIILDEPTSGLDAMTCLTTIKTLKSIVLKHPISIILTIHQPDIDVFNLFDQVYVIAQGGLAIYEGPPAGVVPTLAQVDLFMPSDNYNPARFIVENAFVAVPEEGVVDSLNLNTRRHHEEDDGGELIKSDANEITEMDESDDEEDKREQSSTHDSNNIASNFFRQSLSSITGALSGQLTKAGDFSVAPNAAAGLILGKRGNNEKRFRDSGRRPLLNIGIQMADGKLITSDQLTTSSRSATLNLENEMRKQTLERMRILRRLNQIQKERYYNGTATLSDGSFTSSDILSQQTTLSDQHDVHSMERRHNQSSGCPSSVTGGVNLGAPSIDGSRLAPASPVGSSSTSTWEEARDQLDGERLERASTLSASSSRQDNHRQQLQRDREHFIVNLAAQGGQTDHNTRVAMTMTGSDISPATTIEVNTDLSSGPTQSSGFSQSTDRQRSHSHLDELHDSSCTSRIVTGGANGSGGGRGTSSMRGGRTKLRRQFDKRLSAKRIQSKQGDHPIWYHSFLLTHRTWLSIVRDPVFFGIQFAMHTTIPILLALIFGSSQEEGCPRVGTFDLVEFAYADERSDFLQGTMRSIRKSIGNVGVVFFEMFVLSFAINCITALVFPLDMYVLLKEHRNGWYSLKSYFFGRTLADLPVPIVLHSMAMTILCYMTGQPLSWWRFSAVIGIVILASLVAQSVGLTIGALLMRSSQSAVLAAAGIVAPFFALSGFIVRIHTLPWVAQWAAQGSYLYHLLNGFIIMRYGFGRCPCDEQDFELDESHKIPGNIRTMASMWVGTYSNEFEASHQMVQAHLTEHQRQNRTNIDPNIDIIDKLMGAFKMANSFGHKVDSCDDVLPYAMLDFNLHDSDIWHCCISLALMLVVSRFITFSAIYYKIRSFS